MMKIVALFAVLIFFTPTLLVAQYAHSYAMPIGVTNSNYTTGLQQTQQHIFLLLGKIFSVGNNGSPFTSNSTTQLDDWYTGGYFNWNVYEHTMANWLHFYLTGGFSLNFDVVPRLATSKEDFSGLATIQGQVGFRFFLHQNFDIFVSLDPNAGIEFTPQINKSKIKPYVNLGGSLGVRYWW